MAGECIMTDRDQIRANAAALRASLLGGEEWPAHVPAELADLLDEVLLGTVLARPGLDQRSRMICVLAALAANQRLPALGRHVGPGLDAGLSPLAVQEICVQALLYSGLVAVEDVLEVCATVFKARGVSLPEQARDTASLDELSMRGTAQMNALHGSRAQQGYADPGNAVTGALYPAAIRYGYGALWFRPGLEMRERALVAVAAFTALRMPEQVRKFGTSALNAGLSREEVIEAVIQTAPYGGFPPALNALAGLTEVLRET